MMTNVVYQEESGPGVEVEQVTKQREFSATKNADKSTRMARLEAQKATPQKQQTETVQENQQQQRLV